MTQVKKDACVMLKIDGSDEGDEDIAVSSEEDDILKDISKDNVKKKEHQGDYMNADFILGSVAEVERLWSLAKCALPCHRKSCTPMLTESLLFLKVNKNYWGQSLVCEAMKKRISDKVAAQMAADEAHIALVKEPAE